MPTIAELRQSDPENMGPLSDDSIVRVLKATDYPDKSEADIAKMLGVKPAEAPVPKTGFVRRAASDFGKSLKTGIEQLPGQITGVADIIPALAFGTRPVSDLADKIGNATGFTPGQWAKDTKFSPEYNQSQQDVGESWAPSEAVSADPNATKMDYVRSLLSGAPSIAAAYLRNPMYTANMVANSLPSTLAGGAISRPLMTAGRVAGMAGDAAAGVAARQALPGYMERVVGEKMAAPISGGIGEGIPQAGQQMDQYQGTDQRANAIAALGSGAADAVIGAGSGRIANKLGLETVETAMAKAGDGSRVASGLSGAKRVLGGAASEGLLQEVPQSAQEQAWQNYADNKPLMQGVVRQGIEGGFTGAVMGGAANVPGGHAAVEAAPVIDPRAAKLPETGPMSKAINAGLDAAGERQDAGLPPAAPPPGPPPFTPLPVDSADVPGLLAHANQRAADLEAKAAGTKGDTIPGPDGEKLVVAGAPKQFLTPDEKAELAFLKEHGGNAEALNQVYTRDQDAAITRMHQAAADEAQSLRQFDRAPVAPAAQAAPQQDDANPNPLPGDVLNPKGEPFKNRTAVVKAQKALDDPTSHVIASVNGGWVLRPNTTENSDGSGRTAQPGGNESAGPAVAAAPGGNGPVVQGQLQGGPAAGPITGALDSVASADTAGGTAGVVAPALTVGDKISGTNAAGAALTGEFSGYTSDGRVKLKQSGGNTHYVAPATAQRIEPALSNAQAPEVTSATVESAPASVTAGIIPSTTGLRQSTSKGTRTADAGAPLPKDLASATPRYAYGDKRFELKFASDLDKSAYIAAQATPSKRDADYVAHAVAASGMTEAQVREHGAAVRAAIKAMAKDARPGVLNVPEVARVGAKAQNAVAQPAKGPNAQPAAQPEATQAPAPARTDAPATAAAAELPGAGTAAAQADGVKVAGEPAKLSTIDRRSANAKARMAFNPETDTVLQALAKMGGIRRDIMAKEFGLQPEELKHTVSMGGLKGFPFRKTGGMDMDRAITNLREAGYFTGVPEEDVRAKFEEAVYHEMGGGMELTPQGQMRAGADQAREAAQEHQDRVNDPNYDPFEPGGTEHTLDGFDADHLEQSGYAAASEDVKATTQQMLHEADALGIDTEGLREDAAREANEQSEDYYHARLQAGTHKAITQALADAARADAGRAGAGSQDHVQVAGDQGRAEEGLTLQAQTADDLKAKTEREGAALASEKAQKTAEQARLARMAGTKEDQLRADQTVGDFQLGQTAHDQLAGMGDMFANPKAEASTAPQPTEKPAEAASEPAKSIIGSRTAAQIAREIAKARPNDDVMQVREAARKAIAEELGQKAVDAMGQGTMMSTGDLTQAIHDGQYEGVRAFAASMPVPVHESDIPLETAVRAYSGTSHSPERRGDSARREYVRTMADAWQRAAAAAGADPEALARVTEAMRELVSGYRTRYLATLGARSNVMSSMIAGPAKFPVRANNKRSETADRRAIETSEFLKRGTARMLKAARGPIDNSPASELAQLQKNIAEREAAQTTMKAANAALRKGDDAALKALGFSDERIAELKKPDFGGRTGFPDYRLTNNNAEIRRLRQRLEHATQRVAAAVEGPKERTFAGVKIEENAQDDRLRLRFEGKPSEAVRTDLKANGFKWSPTNEAWQRQLTANARTAADSVLQRHYGEEAQPAPQLSIADGGSPETGSTRLQFDRAKAVANLPASVRNDPFFRPESAAMRDVHARSALWDELQKFSKDEGLDAFSLGVDDIGNIVVGGKVPAPNLKALTEFADARDVGIYVLNQSRAATTDNIPMLRGIGFEPVLGLGAYGQGRSSSTSIPSSSATFAYKPRGISEFMFDLASRTNPSDTASYGQATQAHIDLANKFQAGIDRRYHGTVFHAVDATVGPGGRSEELAAVATAAKRLFGHEVVFVKFEGTPLFNGAMSDSIPGIVFLRADSPRPLMSVLGHELLHQLRATNPQTYQILSNRLATVTKNGQDYVSQLAARYAAKGAGTEGLNFQEELHADIVGDNFMDPAFWQMMAKDQPGGFRRVANIILKFLDGVISKMTGTRPFGTEQFLTDINAARSAVADAMRQFSGTQVGAMRGAGTPDGATAFSMEQNTKMASRKDVVGNNEGGRSADDETPGAKLKAGKAFVSELMRLADENGTVYIRWSPSTERDLSPNAASRDFVSGQTHSGLSAVEITDSMHPVDIAKRLSEYGFLRMQDSKSVPHVYLAQKVGEDSDGYASIRPTKHLLTGDKGVIAAIDSKLSEVMDAEDDIAKLRARIERFGNTQSAGRAITEQSLKDAETKLAKLTNESPAPNSDGASFGRTLSADTADGTEREKGQFSGTQVGAMTEQHEGVNLSLGEDGKPIYTHEVVDPRDNNRVMGKYQTVNAARAGRDRFDIKYGGVRYRVRESAAKPGTGSVNLSAASREAVTDSPAFKRWFGNSKVVDANGKPLVVYHGTQADFDTFATGLNKAKDETGIFFSPDPKIAARWAGHDENFPADKVGSVMPVHLNISNPLIVDFNGEKLGRAEVISNAVAEGRDGVIFKNHFDAGGIQDQYVVFRPEQIKSAIGNRGSFDVNDPNINLSLADTLNEGLNSARDVTSKRSETIAGQTTRQYTPRQVEAFKNVGFQVEQPSLEDRARALWKDAGKKLAQGLVDQFAPVRDIDKTAYGLLRLSKGAAGAFEALLQGGQLKLTEGVYDFDSTNRGGVVDQLLKPLQGEHHDFFRWVAANRAERLMSVGKENLFTPADIEALKSLADGSSSFDYTIQNGAQAGKVTRDRTLIYADSLKTFNEFNTNVLDMAEQSGLIDGEARKMWENEFYVPFYRVEDDGSVAGADIKNGAVRQQAFKSLTGRTEKLNSDLLDNTLMNWAHLLDASAKNRAAKATIEAAENMGSAAKIEGPSGKGTVWFREKGGKRYSMVADPYLLTAITALEYAGMRNPAMNAMGAFKRALTIGVTASPFFKIRNLIRDSIQVIATSPISYNPLANIAQGWKLTHHDSDPHFRMLAGGGTIHFGTMMEGNEAKRVQALVESGVDASTILDGDHKVKAFYRKFIEPSITAYNELGNRGEEINRASLYDQLMKQGVGHAEASLQARDTMDFSMQGSFTSIRFLTQVVPFFNARIQGLYKLGKAAKEDPVRISAVIGAVSLMSLGLLVAGSGDDDWKKREDWDRNNYWWFKFGGTAFRIPKPFEVGAIATLAERGFELAFDKEMTNRRFMDQVLNLVSNNLSMNPIPQLVKPMLDVYANTDSFTNRQIESTGMQKLKPAYRFNNQTTMAARGLSTAANAVTGIIGVDAPSPVQIDHMLQGYFGWLGSFVVGSGDVIARLASGQKAQATPDYWKAATGGMVSDLRDAPSRYVSQMYTQAKEVEQAYETWQGLRKEGKTADAVEFASDNKQNLMQYRQIERVKQSESRLNALLRNVQNSDRPADEKRTLIRGIKTQQDRIARMLQPN